MYKVAEHTQVIDLTREDRRSLVSPVTAGLAGMAASVPMGLVMIALHNYLPGKKENFFDRPKALPPKQITRKAARKVGAEKIMPAGQTWGPVTWLAHLGYGAAVASLFPLLTRPLRLPAVLRGILFGIAVWAGSYQGWLPAAQILPPAAELPARRNAVMLISHILWGSLIGLLVRKREVANLQEDFTI